MARGEPIAALDDEEGPFVPAAAGDVVDAHVHLFPDRVFEAIWRWFDRHAWSIRYRLRAEEVVEFLAAHGVKQLVALHYSHVPGMARTLNAFVADVARAHRDVVIPLGTVLPGETDAREIVREAFALGLHGIKLHCHVQKMAGDDPRLDEIYAACEDAGKPVVIHCGREPSSPAYGFDSRTMLSWHQIERVLQRFPRLTVVVPHLGYDEVAPYVQLLARYEHLWLDTTMVVCDFFPGQANTDVVEAHADRLLYGTDFPNLPFAWDRELTRLAALPLTEPSRRALFSANARRVFGF